MSCSLYLGVPAEHLLAKLNEGHRLEKRECCPQELYDVMKNCWQREPEERPSFEELVLQLEVGIKSKIIVSFVISESGKD